MLSPPAATMKNDAGQFFWPEARFDYPAPEVRRGAPNRIVRSEDGVAEGCLGLGIAMMFLTVIFWPGVTDPGPNRNAALLIMGPFILALGLWGMVRLPYRKRFEFRIDARELHVEERRFLEPVRLRVVSFDAVRIDIRYEKLPSRGGPRWGYFTFVDYGDRPLAMHFTDAEWEAEQAAEELARSTGIARAERREGADVIER